jgi:hypothetical protein
VADAAGLDFDAHGPGARLRDWSFNGFKRALRPGDLHSSHRSHDACSLEFLNKVNYKSAKPIPGSSLFPPWCVELHQAALKSV